jgi:hypothetical protein
MRVLAPVLLSLAIASASAGCAVLNQIGQLVQAPRFEEAPDRPAEIRLLQPGAGGPLGGAGVRLWAKVTNPNAFAFTLSMLEGTLFLDGSRAATADLPLGLPLTAGGETVIPVDFSVSFADLPALGNVIRQAVGRQPIGYRLDGTVGVDAGRFGQPAFGPMTLMRGEIRR